MNFYSFCSVKIFARLFSLVFLLGACTTISAQWLPLNPVKSAEVQRDGVLLVLQTGYLRFQVCSDSVVHIVYSMERIVPERPDFLVVKKSWPKAEFAFRSDDPKLLTLSTAQLKIDVSRADGSIMFFDAGGHKLTQESSHT